MHKAIIKCPRFDLTWEYCNNISSIKEYESSKINEYNRKKGGFDSFIFSDSWYGSMLRHGVKTNYLQTGSYTLFEGVLESEILNTGHHIYVPSLSVYCEINKVEVNHENVVTYHVNYKKYFNQDDKNNRLEIIEEWFDNEYPHLSSFSDLNDKDIKSTHEIIKGNYETFSDNKCLDGEFFYEDDNLKFKKQNYIINNVNHNENHISGSHSEVCNKHNHVNEELKILGWSVLGLVSFIALIVALIAST